MDDGERFNGLSHLVGAILAIAGTAVLIVVSVMQRDPIKIVSFAIYGTMLILVYVASTLYHTLQGTPKAVFRKLDHLSIYLLIAGTYTPFTLAALRDDVGWILFGTVWGLAVVGIVHDLVATQKARVVPAILALVMGWLAIFALEPLAHAITPAGLAWVIAGGILYTVGVTFYAMRRLRYGHSIWHVFVIFGSVAHYVAIVGYVA
ncbi:MAG TPA: hemolysin III family protein [Thermoanaerobaculia bacterium]